MTQEKQKIENIERIAKINEGIMKSFDNIMYQQEKMDNKAFIFIGFFSVLLGVINKNDIINSPINWILGCSIFLLALSLIPITSKFIVNILNFIIKKKNHSKHNIFYYTDIYNLDLENFKLILKQEYQLGYFTSFELNLLEQILINAKILRTKVFWHTLAYQFILISFIIWAIILIVNQLFFN